MANLPGSFATATSGYSLLSEFAYLSTQWGTYKNFIEKYPSLARSSYILQSEGSGNGVYTPTRVYTHWEPKGKTLPSFRITADTTATAGLPITVTLTAGSHTGTAGSKSPVAIGYVFENSQTRQIYRVTNVNKAANGAHTATLLIDTATAVPLVTAATDQLVYRGRVLVEEASTFADSLNRENVAIANECRTIRDDFEFTDRLMFEKLINPAGGYYYKNDQLDNVMRPRIAAIQEMDLMFGRTANNLGANNSNGRGLIQDIEANGTPIGTVSTVDAAFWQALKRVVEAEGYSREYDFLTDPELYIRIETYLGTAYNNGAVIYCAPDDSSKPMEISQNFKSYSIFNIKYNFLEYDYFNSAKMFGTPISTPTSLGGYYNYGVLIPQGEVADAKTNAPVKRFAVRYQSEKEGDPAFNMWTTGAYSPENKTPVAELRVHAIANKNIETYGIQGFISVNLT